MAIPRNRPTPVTEKPSSTASPSPATAPSDAIVPSGPGTQVQDPSPTPVPTSPTPAPVPVPVMTPEPLPAVALATPSVPPSGAFDAELLERLRRLTPEQRARVRGVTAESGLVASGMMSRRQPDGSVQVLITIGVDNVEQLRVWAEEARLSFEEQVQTLVDYLLSAYLNSMFSSPMEAAAAQKTPAAVAATAKT